MSDNYTTQSFMARQLFRLLIWTSLASRFVHSYYISQPGSEKAITNCGSTIEEARSLGCQFDMYSFGYYPPECYNKPQLDHFLSLHLDDIESMLSDYSPISQTEFLECKYENLWTTTYNFHDLHCTYEWTRLLQALAQKRPLDKKLSEYSHSYHCSQKLLEKDKSNRNGSEANMLFGSCGLTAEQMWEYGTR